MHLNSHATCEMQRDDRWGWRAAVELPTISERSQEVGITRRCTVSSAVSPVGPDLVGTSVAVGERVSPQRPPFEGAVRASRIASSGPPTKIWAWYATVYAPRAFWLVACLQPPPRAQGVTGPPYKGPGSIPPKRCLMITHLFTGLVPRIMRTITSQRGLWWEPRAVRMSGGGSSNLMR